MNPSAPLIADDIFATEEKLLGALVSVRNSALKIEEKAAIRDLILDYAGTTDEARRLKLKNEITIKLAPAVPEPKPVPVSAAPVTSRDDSTNKVTLSGRVRPVPVFTSTSTATKAPEQKQPEPQREVAPPISNESHKSTPVDTAKAPEIPPPQTKPPEVVVKAEPVSSPNTSAKDRINEIKHDINQRVGNPVNLISTDEVIGREYMSALLNAMKSASSGDGSAKEALAHLEDVYKKVNDLLAKGSLPKKETPKPPIPEQPAVKEVPRPVTPPQKPADKPETRNSALLTSLIQKDKQASAIVAKLQSVSPATNPIHKTEHQKLTVKTAELKKPADTTNPHKLSPVSTITALPEQIETLRKKSVDQENEAKKPITDLQSEKVTAGLKQLLYEWKLFHGSGWFGTGPTGMDHPLYKAIANLSMAAVVAGRFEGATPEVKQTLADYMNGWRYEQGIVHDMGESFEHYLRRVILHILGRPRDPRQPDQESKT